jgi:hypothetical protein
MLHFGHDLADMEFMRGHRATPVWPSLAARRCAQTYRTLTAREETMIGT